MGIYPRGIYVLQVIHFEGLRSGESSVTSTNTEKPVLTNVNIV